MIELEAYLAKIKDAIRIFSRPIRLDDFTSTYMQSRSHGNYTCSRTHPYGWYLGTEMSTHPPSTSPYTQPPSVHQTVVVQPAVLWQSRTDADAHTMAWTNTMDMVDFLCVLLCTLRSEMYMCIQVWQQYCSCYSIVTGWYNRVDHTYTIWACGCSRVWGIVDAQVTWHCTGVHERLPLLLARGKIVSSI